MRELDPYTMKKIKIENKCIMCGLDLHIMQKRN